MSLSNVRIILVEPAGPLNVGSVARVMKNMGFCQLVLVQPQCDRLSPEARQMAVHAADLLEAAQEVATLSEALQGCHRAIATTGLDRTRLNVPLESPRQALPWLLDSSFNADRAGLDGPQIEAQLQVEAQLQSALIFGREDHGLTKAELNYAQRFVRIPTPSTYTSLNLAQAVAICCYELAMIQARSDIEPEEFREKRLTENRGGDRVLGPRDAFLSSTSVSPAAIEILEGYYQHLESLLLQIGYLYPHTATRRMEKLRRLYHRASPSEAEVAMLRGVLSQVEWALQNAAVLNSRP